MLSYEEAVSLRDCIQQGIMELGDWRWALQAALETAEDLVAELDPNEKED